MISVNCTALVQFRLFQLNGVFFFEGIQLDRPHGCLGAVRGSSTCYEHVGFWGTSEQFVRTAVVITDEVSNFLSAFTFVFKCCRITALPGCSFDLLD